MFKKKKKKSAREQQHCWDSVGQKIFKNNRFIYTFLKKNQINISYGGTCRKKNPKTNVEQKGSVSGQLFIINPVMKPSKLNRARKKNARYVADD